MKCDTCGKTIERGKKYIQVINKRVGTRAHLGKSIFCNYHCERRFIDKIVSGAAHLKYGLKEGD